MLKLTAEAEAKFCNWNITAQWTSRCGE